jgi:hypothetical protein
MEELKAREHILVRHIETRVPRADSGDNRAKQDIRLDTHALVRHHGWSAWQVADLIECVRLVGAE